MNDETKVNILKCIESLEKFSCFIKNEYYHEVKNVIKSLNNIVSLSCCKENDNFFKFINIINSNYLELDIIRWLYLINDEKIRYLIKKYIKTEDFENKYTKKIFEIFDTIKIIDNKLDAYFQLKNIFKDDEKMLFVIEEMFRRRIPEERALELSLNTIQKFLDKKFIKERELIKEKIQTSNLNDLEIINLLKEFDKLKNEHIVVTID